MGAGGKGSVCETQSKSQRLHWRQGQEEEEEEAETARGLGGTRNPPWASHWQNRSPPSGGDLQDKTLVTRLLRGWQLVTRPGLFIARNQEKEPSQLLGRPRRAVTGWRGSPVPGALRAPGLLGCNVTSSTQTEQQRPGLPMAAPSFPPLPAPVTLPHAGP